MNNKQLRLAAFTRHLLGASPVGGREAVLQELPGAQTEAAFGALESARNDLAFLPGQEALLEAIVLPKLRPAILIENGTFPDLEAPWQGISTFRTELETVIRSVGRVEIDHARVPFGGTGFVVGKNLVLTNRHVAELFTYGVGGASRLRFISNRNPRLENAHEYPTINRPGLTFRVVKTLMVHPHWDAALLQVEFDGDPADVPSPLALCATAPDTTLFGEQDLDMVAIGYPQWSEGHDPAIMKEVFKDVFGVKRLQPGRLMRYEVIGSYNHAVEALLHDASTLGGNSGSAIVHVQTQQVMALHFAGTYLVANYSVPMWDLARDPRLVDAGVNFVPAPAAQPRTSGEGGPIWLDAWRGRENVVPANVAPTVAVPGGTVMAAAEAPLLGRIDLIDPGWFERYSDEELRRMYQRNPEQFRALVAASFSPEEAQDLYDTVLLDASVEGVRERVSDPSLPEIVLIPGILGSHLKGSFWGRSWMNALTLPFSNLLGTLGLDGNGNDPNGLDPDGYLEMSYGKAARAWRREGFLVHEFSYDWRKPLVTSAQRLDRFLRTRRRARPEARFALVCHSMGGLVASVYSRDVSDWRDYVGQAIFCGSPLGGSFAVMEILTGEYPFVRKIEKVSLNTSLNEMRQMGASFPGALEMLPHPALFSRPGADVEKLYRRESYADFARPGGDWLRAARRIKDDIRSAPILGRTTCLVCVDRPTTGTFVTGANGEVSHSNDLVRGDATVPAISALVEGVPAYKVTNEHSELLNDYAVVETVPDLLRGRPIALDRVDLSVLDEPLREAPLESPEAKAVKWQLEAVPVRERMRKGISTADDLRWLLSSE